MILPSISIITPSFNQAQFLEESILSVINQKFPFAEYLIIDGQSTDGSVEIIKKYEKHLAYWNSEKDSGQSEAINKGLKKANGEIIAWLNSDDLYFPDTLATVAKLFMENPEVGLIYGDVINFSYKGEEEYYKVSEFDPVDFISRNPIHQPSVFWKRKILEEIGYLDESLYYMMDYDLWMKIFFRYKTIKVNRPLSKFRVHDTSKTAYNPKGLYWEYRQSVSRFFYSLNEEGLVDKLKKLEIYLNKNDIKYTINSSRLPLEKMLYAYIHQCAVQEYTWKNVKKANRLFLSGISYPPHLFSNSLFLLKNNLHLKYFFP